MVVFVDVKKAVYTVDHNNLCKKLEHYGVKSRELCWFKSYLIITRGYFAGLKGKIPKSR